jgi:CRP-like cAMP-binding protein
VNKEGFYSFSFLKEVATLGDGKAFGELALLTTKQRAASIVCTTNSHFMTLSKEQFEGIVQVMKKRELEAQIALIDMFNILAPLSKMTKQKLSYFMEPRKLIKG